MLAMWASWPIDKHVKAYCILFLLLETGMLGVFLSLDFFLFYVFWEVMLLPMYFLIGIWGGPRREYAAIKFFLFTLVGSVLMLIAMLMLYFASDLQQAQRPSNWPHCSIVADAADRAAARLPPAGPQHTFNILALAEMGQSRRLAVPRARCCGASRSPWWAFLLLFVGFVIKLPAVPVHTWLPDAHVEAPTPISMILAGVLLKMGGYGVLRICYPICPDAGYDLAWLVCGLGVVSMVYGAFAAMAQKDFKRLVAYSSVSHMGYVLLGIGVWSAVAGNRYNSDYWKMGMSGAMFQMIAHGISSAGMFFLVGVVYDRVHHRDLDQFGGLFAADAGLRAAFRWSSSSPPWACRGCAGSSAKCSSCCRPGATAWCWRSIAAAVVILTAGYILWTIQRVYLGPEYKGPHGEALAPDDPPRDRPSPRRWWRWPSCFGVYPQALFDYITPSVNEDGRGRLADVDEHRTMAAMPAAAGVAGVASERPAVNFDELVRSRSCRTDALAHRSGRSGRELALCATIVAVLLANGRARAGRPARFYVTLVGLVRGRSVLAVTPWRRGCRADAGRRPADLHRHAGRRQLHASSCAACCCCSRCCSSPSRRVSGVPDHDDADRVLRADARRHAGHVPDDLGQPRADRLAGRRDGQRALLRAGRHAAAPPHEQRGRA